METTAVESAAAELSAPVSVPPQQALSIPAAAILRAPAAVPFRKSRREMMLLCEFFMCFFLLPFWIFKFIIA